MGNKFLELYPELWVPRIGDRVRVIKSNINLINDYKKGETGIIIDIDHNSPEYLIACDREVLELWANKEDVEIIFDSEVLAICVNKEDVEIIFDSESRHES